MCEHKWVKSSDIAAPGCGAGDGDNVFQEITPMATTTPSPEPGDICFSCAQIYGQPEGIKDPRLLALEKLLRSYE
jgi:hypothetical protein